MKSLVPIFLLLLVACTSAIKDQKSEKENPAVAAVAEVEEVRPEPTLNLDVKSKEDLIGYWVGWFEPDLTEDQLKTLSAKNYRPHSNKINISIDRIQGDSVFGHSIVANNNRPFSGQIVQLEDKYTFTASEPGDDKHDGVFKFIVNEKDSAISGSWLAYDSELNVPKRKYKLTKRIFIYEPSVELEGWFADYSKTRMVDLTVESAIVKYGTVRGVIESVYYDMDLEGKSEQELELLMIDAISEHNEYNEGEYYSVTSKYNEKNPSVDVLTDDFVSELTRADIYVMRNSIYARHGYSFKKKTLRGYFDRMRWYIPVHANIRSDLTEVEKNNIKMLLAYEEHAEEYYDEFGR